MWKIGQKVVCVKAHSQGVLQVGKIYTIADILQCTCGQILLGIGLEPRGNGMICLYCGKRMRNHTTHWIGSSLFRPIQNQSKYEIISSTELISEEVIEKTDVQIKIEDPTL